jgi:hypothetical protein
MDQFYQYPGEGYDIENSGEGKNNHDRIAWKHLNEHRHPERDEQEGKQKPKRTAHSGNEKIVQVCFCTSGDSSKHIEEKNMQYGS